MLFSELNLEVVLVTDTDPIPMSKERAEEILEMLFA
jgi:hypothetical protein